MAKDSLTPLQSAFVGEYLADLNCFQAALRAGYKNGNLGRRVKDLPKVDAAIQVALAERAKRVEVTADRVLQEYARIAFFDVRNLIGEDGKPLAIKDLDEETSRAIVGLDVVNIGNSDSGVGEVLKFKLADKKGALDSLAKHLGMFSGTGSGDDEPPPPTKVEIIVKDARKPSQ